MKRNYDYDFFIEHIKKIVKNTDNNPLFMNKSYSFCSLLSKTKNSSI
jgi:hypothetical protein